MESLQVTAIFPAIAPEHLDEFKQLASDVLQLVRAEPRTLQYDWFFSPDGTRCVVRETYVSSDAVLEHLGNTGPSLSRLIELGSGLELDVFGSPSAEVSKALAAMSPTTYEYFEGK